MYLGSLTHHWVIYVVWVLLVCLLVCFLWSGH